MRSRESLPKSHVKMLQKSAMASCEILGAGWPFSGISLDKDGHPPPETDLPFVGASGDLYYNSDLFIRL